MRMYKNCPERGRKECSGCPRFKRCLFKKLKRVLKKNWWKILWVAILVVLIIFLYGKVEKESILQGKEEPKNDIAVTNEITKKFAIATVKCQAKTIIGPTSTPKATEKPKAKKQVKKTAKSTATTKVKATQKPKTAKSKKVTKVAKAKRSSSKQKEYIISSEILEAYAELSAYDLKLMEKVDYAEARGESLKGQISVVAVILNRYIYYKGKKSIEEIVTAKNQFAKIDWITQEMLDEYPICKKAVQKAISGQDPTRAKFPKGARYFYEPDSPYISEYQLKIREGVKGLKIGCHIFHNDFNE